MMSPQFGIVDKLVAIQCSQTESHPVLMGMETDSVRVQHVYLGCGCLRDSTLRSTSHSFISGVF